MKKTRDDIKNQIIAQIDINGYVTTFCKNEDCSFHFSIVDCKAKKKYQLWDLLIFSKAKVLKIAEFLTNLKDVPVSQGEVEPLFVFCNCYSEILVIDYDVEDRLVYFEIYNKAGTPVKGSSFKSESYFTLDKALKLAEDLKKGILSEAKKE